MKCIDWFEELFRTTCGWIVTLCGIVALASPASAQAQTPDISTRGFSLGGHVAVIGANADSFGENGHRADPARVTAGGGGFVVAYGVNEWLTVALNGDGHESEDDRHLTFADIGAQLFVPAGNRVRPHFDVALTGRRAEFTANSAPFDTRGSSLTIGGGLLYFVSRSFALDAALLWTAGDLDRYADGKRVKDADAIGVSGIRFLIGVRWFLRR
ncbi:MAG TPA: outer membrane beta-barrel protein [Vicinamibacterales bacterium]|nr:outer membrane beta-barrel protein [Vicinamibacterales bacterium]